MNGLRWCTETTEPWTDFLTIRSSFYNQQSNADSEETKKGGHGLSWYSKTTAPKGDGMLKLKMPNFSGCVLLYKSTHSNLYVRANCTCKILNTERKIKEPGPGCSSINSTGLKNASLEKTMLAPTCTISSLLILTITVRRTRWSVGRGVLRVVTQAYQWDEETRLTEPRYCWPTTLHSSPLTELEELYTQLLGLHYSTAQLHLEVKTKWSVSLWAVC